ncbi:MAG: hypothetical protein QME81_08970 [bacterium]|nr:hypothetical protein [bacterium]
MESSKALLGEALKLKPQERFFIIEGLLLSLDEPNIAFKGRFIFIVFPVISSEQLVVAELALLILLKQSKLCYYKQLSTYPQASH